MAEHPDVVELLAEIRACPKPTCGDTIWNQLASIGLIPRGLQRPSSPLAKRLVASVIAAVIADALSAPTGEHTTGTPSPQSQARSRRGVSDLAIRLRAQLDEAYAKPLRLDALAREYATSRTTLVRQFRAAHGESPAQYVRGVRLRRAAEAIQSGPDKIDTIAGMVGFKSRKRFYELFRATYGCTPSTLRVRREMHEPE